MNNFNLKNWLTGFMIGLSGGPCPMYKNKAAKCLYNGTVLPTLPFWNQTKYPYAFIIKNGDVYRLYVIDKKVFVDNDNYIYASVSTGSSAYYLKFETDLQNSTWTTDNSLYGAISTSTLGTKNSLLWTNTRIANRNNSTILLESSSPIPIYK